MAKKNKKREVIEIDDVSIKECDADEDNDLDFDDEEDSRQVDDNHNNKKDDYHKGNKKKPLLLIFFLVVLFFSVSYYYIYPRFFNDKSKKAALAAPKRNDLDFINNNRKIDNAPKNNEKKEQPPVLPLKPLINNFEEERRIKQERERKENEEKEKEVKRLNEDLSKFISDQVQETLKKFDDKESQGEFQESLLYLKESSTKKNGGESKKVLLNFEKEKKSYQENLETKAKSLQSKFEIDLENLSITEEKLDIFKREANILCENCRKDLAILIKKADTDYDKLIDKIKKEVERIRENEKEELKKSIQEKARKIIQDFNVNVIQKSSYDGSEYMQKRYHEVSGYIDLLQEEGKMSDIFEALYDNTGARERDLKKISKDFKEEIDVLSEMSEYEKFDEESEKIVKKYEEKAKRVVENYKEDYEEFISSVIKEAERVKKEKEKKEQEKQTRTVQEGEQTETAKKAVTLKPLPMEEVSDEEWEKIKKDPDVVWTRYEDQMEPAEKVSDEEWEKMKKDPVIWTSYGGQKNDTSNNDFYGDPANSEPADYEDDIHFGGFEMTLKNGIFCFIAGQYYRNNGRRLVNDLIRFVDNAKDIATRMEVTFHIPNNQYVGYFSYLLLFLLVWYTVTAIIIFLISFFITLLVSRNFSLKKCFKIKNIIFAPFYGSSFNFNLFKIGLLFFDFFEYLAIFNVYFKKYCDRIDNRNNNNH